MGLGTIWETENHAKNNLRYFPLQVLMTTKTASVHLRLCLQFCGFHRSDRLSWSMIWLVSHLFSTFCSETLERLTRLPERGKSTLKWIQWIHHEDRTKSDEQL